MKIIGHRGAKGLAQENTVAAILKGLKCHVDMIEVDVRLQNKELVLSHDETVKTTSYCTLHNALEALNGKKPLVLDIKEVEVVDKLSQALKNYKGVIIFSSRKFDALQKIKALQQANKLDPGAELAVIESWSGVRAVTQSSLLGTNRIHIKHTWLWSGFVRSMKHRGYNLYAYTVNTVERAEELDDWGLKGIFTDYPDRFSDMKKRNHN